MGNIKEIKKKIEDESLSLIIGAGFSKNISNTQFLNWKQLLCDMVKEMYSDEIDRFKRSKKEVERIINKVGYLELASEYIRRKGFREAIDIYIEERTPYLKSQDEKVSLWKEDRKVMDILDAELDSHRKLINLGVKNIYTFNYDNALEFVAETGKSSELLEEERSLEREILALDEAYKEYDKLIKNLEIEIKQNLESKQINRVQSENNSSSQTEKKNGIIVQINDHIKKSKILGDLGFLQIDKDNDSSIECVIDKNKDSYNLKKSNLKNRKDNIKSQRKNLYHLIKSSREISLTEQNKSIFKLHGNLRLPIVKDEKYGFDNDIRKQYVICKEDYETYSDKHDAFVSLMKIALLRGSFCLLGFSGDDPNFLKWMSWVREVNGGDDSSGDEKIFFIDVDTSISKEKRLLLKNHNIAHVALKDLFPEEASSPSLLISSFLDEISPSSSYYGKYKEAWSKISITTNHNNPPTVILDGVDQLWKSLDYCRYPKLDSREHYSRDNLLLRMSSLINLIDERSAKAIYAAFVGELLPLSAVIDYNIPKNEKESEINRFMRQVSNLEDTASLFQVLNIRSKILHNRPYKKKKSENCDAKIYESCLSLLLNLNFDGAKAILEDWKPTGYWAPKRFALLSTLRKMKQTEWKDEMLPDYYSCPQDYIYGVDTITAVRGILFTKSDGGISEKDVQESEWLDNVLTKNPNLNRLWDNINYLKKQLNDKKEKVEPLGKNTIMTSFNSWNYPMKYSIQLLQAFLEIGMPMQTFSMSYIDKSDWFKAFKNIFTTYPHPCLYFSLQFGADKAFVQRIAQEYTFSTSITNKQLSEMLVNMLKACNQEDTPTLHDTKQGIYVMASIFMDRVDYNRWGTHFETFYEKFAFSDTDINRTSIDTVYNFILAGVKYSTNANFKLRIILDVLHKLEDIDNFYNSLLISATEGLDIESQSDELESAIDNLLATAKRPAHYFVLMNLYKVLSKNQQENLITSLINYDYPNDNDSVLLEASSKFLKGCATGQDKIKQEIVKSKLLWKNEIKIGSNGGYSVAYSGYNPLNINKIQLNINFEDRLIFNIYEKLKVSFSEIKGYIDAHQNIHNLHFGNSWKQLLIQMQVFLRTNKKVLSSQDDYKIITSDVVEYYEKESEVENILEALISGNSSKVGNAIERLVYDCKMYGIKKFMQEYQTIAQMIILRTDVRLNSCIVHFSWSLSENYENLDKSIFTPLVKIILEQYSHYYKSRNAINWEFDAEKDVIEKYLVNLYSTYKKWYGKLTFWENYKPIFISNMVKSPLTPTSSPCYIEKIN